MKIFTFYKESWNTIIHFHASVNTYRRRSTSYQKSAQKCVLCSGISLYRITGHPTFPRHILFKGSSWLLGSFPLKTFNNIFSFRSNCKFTNIYFWSAGESRNDRRRLFVFEIVTVASKQYVWNTVAWLCACACNNARTASVVS